MDTIKKTKDHQYWRGDEEREVFALLWEYVCVNYYGGSLDNQKQSTYSSSPTSRSITKDLMSVCSGSNVNFGITHSKREGMNTCPSTDE